MKIIQPTTDDDAVIIGSVAELLCLRNLIDDAIQLGVSSFGDFNASEDVYTLIITPRSGE